MMEMERTWIVDNFEPLKQHTQEASTTGLHIVKQ